MLGIVPLLFLAVLTVKHDQTALRSGCSEDESVVATLAAGTPVEVRFAISDGSRCLKIKASQDGRDVVGYVSEDALANVDQFDQARRAGASLDGEVADLGRKLVASGPPPTNSSISKAIALLQGNQPQQALEILEPAAKQMPTDANLLAVTGIAAYRSDQARAALDYWTRSLALRPNADLQALVGKLQRELAGDQSKEKLYGNRVLVRYEGGRLPDETARGLVAMLDTEVARVADQLGCNSHERLIAIVQTPAAYRATTGAAEWSGGLYDGRIHLPMPEGSQIDAATRRAVAHETVHACLAAIPSGATPWPAWLHEGLAQKLSGDTMPAAARESVLQQVKDHALPRLEVVGQDWSRLSTGNARRAYALALVAADTLLENYSDYGLRNVLNNPERLPALTAELDRRLGY